MADATEIASVLYKEAGTHHRAFRIINGAEDDWACWYPEWLISVSELPSVLATRPVRS